MVVSARRSRWILALLFEGEGRQRYNKPVEGRTRLMKELFLLKMTFDPLATLAPIAKVADVPLVLFSNPALPARTLGELIAYARASPGKLSTR